MPMPISPPLRLFNSSWQINFSYFMRIWVERQSRTRVSQYPTRKFIYIRTKWLVSDTTSSLTAHSAYKENNSHRNVEYNYHILNTHTHTHHCLLILNMCICLGRHTAKQFMQITCMSANARLCVRIWNYLHECQQCQCRHSAHFMAFILFECGNYIGVPIIWCVGFKLTRNFNTAHITQWFVQWNVMPFTHTHTRFTWGFSPPI